MRIMMMRRQGRQRGRLPREEGEHSLCRGEVTRPVGMPAARVQAKRGLGGAADSDRARGTGGRVGRRQRSLAAAAVDYEPPLKDRPGGDARLGDDPAATGRAHLAVLRRREAAAACVDLLVTAAVVNGDGQRHIAAQVVLVTGCRREGSPRVPAAVCKMSREKAAVGEAGGEERRREECWPSSFACRRQELIYNRVDEADIIEALRKRLATAVWSVEGSADALWSREGEAKAVGCRCEFGNLHARLAAIAVNEDGERHGMTSSAGGVLREAHEVVTLAEDASSHHTAREHVRLAGWSRRHVSSHARFPFSARLTEAPQKRVRKGLHLEDDRTCHPMRHARCQRVLPYPRFCVLVKYVPGQLAG